VNSHTLIGLPAVALPVPREPAPLPVMPELPPHVTAALRRQRGRTPVLRVVRFPFGAVPTHHTGEAQRRILDVTALEMAPGDIEVEIVERATEEVVRLESLCGSDQSEIGRAVMVRLRPVDVAELGSTQEVS